jgi:hypothetical protein
LILPAQVLIIQALVTYDNIERWVLFWVGSAIYGVLVWAGVIPFFVFFNGLLMVVIGISLLVAVLKDAATRDDHGPFD